MKNEAVKGLLWYETYVKLITGNNKNKERKN